MTSLPDGISRDVKIVSMGLEDYAMAVEAFHGCLAPGLLIGGFMVDQAYKNLPKGEFFDAVSESPNCLPDAIQLLTPCSIGNGWLKVVDTGRFALTLFEKYSGAGVRVSVDSAALQEWPEIRNWFFKLVPKHEQDQARLIAQILEAGASILAIARTEVDPRITQKIKGQKVTICPECQESFPAKLGVRCGHCSGKAVYYKPVAGALARIMRLAV